MLADWTVCGPGIVKCVGWNGISSFCGSEKNLDAAGGNCLTMTGLVHLWLSLCIWNVHLTSFLHVTFLELRRRWDLGRMFAAVNGGRPWNDHQM